MREIKFRHPVPLVGEFHYWHYWGFINGIFVAPIGDLVIAQEKSQQFTERRDKEGKDIYTGDIIKSKEYPFYGDDDFLELNYVGVIGIDVEGVYYDIKAISDRVAGRACGGNLSELKSPKIIGNVTENPELLK